MMRAFLVDDSDDMIPRPYEPEDDFSAVDPHAPFVGEWARADDRERDEVRA
jgi:hypothetical protein